MDSNSRRIPFVTDKLRIHASVTGAGWSSSEPVVKFQCLVSTVKWGASSVAIHSVETESIKGSVRLRIREPLVCRYDTGPDGSAPIVPCVLDAVLFSRSPKPLIS